MPLNNPISNSDLMEEGDLNLFHTPERVNTLINASLVDYVEEVTEKLTSPLQNGYYTTGAESISPLATMAAATAEAIVYKEATLKYIGTAYKYFIWWYNFATSTWITNSIARTADYALSALSASADYTRDGIVKLKFLVQKKDESVFTASALHMYDIISCEEYNYPRVFYCGANRTLSTLKAGIEEAVKYMDSILYVDAGVYDLITEFGAPYFEALTSASNMAGLTLKNRIHIIFSANSIVRSHYTGTNQYAQSLYSPFNVGMYGFIIEGLTLECSKCRYALHDERAGSTEQCIHKYVNCNLLIDNSSNTYWANSVCIGGGLGSNSTVDISNSHFNGTTGISDIYYHQSSALTNANHKGILNIHNTYCEHGTISLIFNREDATEDTIAQVSNCSFATVEGSLTNGIFVTAQKADETWISSPDQWTHAKLFAWNNVVRAAV